MSNYNIDDILDEVSANRKNGVPPEAASEPEPHGQPRLGRFDPAGYLAGEEEDEPEQRHGLRLFRRKPRPEEVWQDMDADAETEEEPVTVWHASAPSAPTSDEPVESQEEIARTRTVETATRVVVLPEEMRAPDFTVSASPAPADDRQMTLDGYALDEPEDGTDDPEAEQRAEQMRRERVEGFRLNRDGDVPTEPDKTAASAAPYPAPEKQTDVLEDYTGYEDTPLVRTELRYRLRTSLSALILTAVLETVCVLITLLSSGTFRDGTLFFFMVTLHTILLAVMMIANFQTVRRGLTALFCLRADSESAAAVTGVAVLFHTLLQYFSSGQAGVPVLTPIAGAALVLAAWGRFVRSRRVYENFRFVSYPGDKFVAQQIRDPKTATEIGRPAVALGTPRVTYFKRVPFLPRFLECSYSADPADRCMKAFVPCALGAAILLTLLYGFICGWMSAATIGIGTLAVTMPAALLAVHLPLWRAAQKALRHGGMISGWDAAEEYDGVHALTVNASDLFRSENVPLYDIRPFEGARIDQAILDIAAVTIQAGGTIASVFRRVIENKLEILPPVENIMYEHDMGLSGWVNGRRVLVGNRRLMENHGVDTPSLAYEERYRKHGRQLLYLASGGVLSAMVVVGYTGDPTIAALLRQLNRAGVTLLVRTNDPNITAPLICDAFDLNDYYVEMLGATASRTCAAVVAAGERDYVAHRGPNGRIEGIAAAMSGCHRVRRAGQIALIVQIVCGVLCFGVCAISALSKGALPTESFSLLGTGMVFGSALLARLISRLGGI